MSRGFWAIVISFAGSQTKSNKRRQALASAVCYGSLMYTRWKGFAAVVAQLKEQRQECREKQKLVWIFSLLEDGFVPSQQFLLVGDIWREEE